MTPEPNLRPSTRFRDHREQAIFNLALTYGVLLDRTLAALKPFQVNDQHYNILKILAEHDPEPISVGEIFAELLDKRGDLTRLLDKLVTLGFAHRETNPLNRRMVNVTIMPVGISQLREMDSLLAKERDVLSNLSEDEARQLNWLLDKLRG